ncbi:E3 ubiquitin-protein ligase RNF170 [Linum perenne]
MQKLKISPATTTTATSPETEAPEVDATCKALVSGGETKAAGDLASIHSGNVDRKASTSPPVDDCCPICFGEFSVACKANCGHWYCGNCILQLWNYSSASRPCKCPMCSSSITNLTPEASFFNQQDSQVLEVLQSVERYNRLYVGGARGLVQKVLESPFLIKKLVIRMMDPDRHVNMYTDSQIIFLILTILHIFTPVLDFIPLSDQGAHMLFHFGSTAIVVILRLIGLYRRRRLNQRVMQMAAAAAQPLPE